MATPSERRCRRRRALAVLGALLLAIAWRLPALLRASDPSEDPIEDDIDVPLREVLAPGSDAVLVPGFRIEIEPMQPLELDVGTRAEGR